VRLFRTSANRAEPCLNGDSFRIAPVNIAGRDLKVLAEWMVLVYTGVKRRATAVVAEQVQNTSSGALDAELREMLAYVDASQEILEDASRRDEAPARIGALLHQSWQVKEAALRQGQRTGNRRALRILPRQRGDRRQIMRRRRRRLPAVGGVPRAPRRVRSRGRRAAMRPLRDRLPGHGAARFFRAGAAAGVNSGEHRRWAWVYLR
jgi:hypothetical protein